MTARGEARCPLCGARLSADDLLDAGQELADGRLGVFRTCCPHCQGRLEAMPSAGRVDVGYLEGSRGFAVVLSLACPGLVVGPATDGEGLVLQAAGRRWCFAAVD